MPTLEHPSWCDISRCTTSAGGYHESSTVRVTGNGGRAPRILLLLLAPVTGYPVRLRMVSIGELLINSVDLDLDGAALLSASLAKLITLTAPPEG